MIAAHHADPESAFFDELDKTATLLIRIKCDLNF